MTMGCHARGTRSEKKRDGSIVNKINNITTIFIITIDISTKMQINDDFTYVRRYNFPNDDGYVK